MNKIALITGATAGIGKATALLLAENSYNVIITGRRQELLDEMKKEIEVKHKRNALSLCFDVRNQQEVEKAIGSIPSGWKNIDVLVNNAGLAVGLNPVQNGIIDDWERMIDTNIKGLLYVTQSVLPIMIERARVMCQYRLHCRCAGVRECNVYCASKHAVNALSGHAH